LINGATNGEVRSQPLSLGEGPATEFDHAELALRRVLRPSDNWWRLAPRVVVAAPRAEIPKRGLKDIAVYAGARDVITLPKVMAAALGAGVDVKLDRITAVLYLEREWLGFAVIRKAEVRAGWERAGGVDQILENIAAQTGTAQGPAPDFEFLREKLKVHGMVEPAARAGANQFVASLRERCRREVERLSVGDQRDWRREPLYLLGPYADIPGLRELVAQSWACEVIVPYEPERAVILGCAKVLAELDEVMTTFSTGKK
jgi:actin-like ATPase involved in cell morphogenesis